MTLTNPKIIEDDAMSSNSKLNNDNVSFKRSISLSNNSRLGKKMNNSKSKSKLDQSSILFSQ